MSAAPPTTDRWLRRGRRARRTTAAIAASALAAGAAMALAPETGLASSHREGPLIAGDPAADNTDLYAFISPDAKDSVTFIANWQPFEEPAGGPNFYPFDPDARYNIKIDNDGDAKADVTYRWTFTTHDRRGTNTFLYANGPVTALNDANLLFRQTYTLTEINERGRVRELIKDAPVAPSHVGKATMPNYAALRNAAVHSSGKDGVKSFAGQADDPFFLDLRVFDLLYGGDLSETGSDTLAAFNVNSIAVQVPLRWLTKKDDPVLGVWTTTERRTMRVQRPDGTQQYQGSDWVQVSRLGNPLVNEVVIPAGLKDAFNALDPRNDATVKPAVDRVLDPELARLIEAVYGVKAPATPRNDLFAIYLTGLKGLNRPAPADVRPAELLRLNTAIAPSAKPNRLGVLAGDNAGFPNGRRLTDDVVDISIQAVEGAVSVDAKGAPKGVTIVKPLAAGDKVDVNDKGFGSTFPYLALPHSGSDVRSGSARGGSSGSADSAAAALPGPSAESTPPSAAPAKASVPSVPSVPRWAYAAGLGGIAVLTLGIAAALHGRRRRPRPRHSSAPAHSHG